MKTKILATLGAASIAMAMSTTASHALLGYEPGESMGLATGAALPEGVFGVDTELYGHRDGADGRTGLNIPILIWSTPFTFYNTRLEVVVAEPVFHSDGYHQAAGVNPREPAGNTLPLTDNQTRVYNQAFGFIFAHDFGNKFGMSLTTLYHTPSAQFIPHNWADIRVAASYTGDGFDLTAQAGYTGTFGTANSLFGGGTFGGQSLAIPGFAYGSLPGISDAVNIDLTATKTFGKFEIGVTGFAHTDIENGLDNSCAVGLQGTCAPGQLFKRAGAIAVGGLIGYDFGKFTVQGDVTREVAKRGAPQLQNGTGKETRGFLRLVVPLYVAPAAPAPVVARY